MVDAATTKIAGNEKKFISKSCLGCRSQGMTRWINGWKRNGWRTSQKKPVKNRDLWERLDASLGSHDIEWCWVKGHSGDPGNERADLEANLAIDRMLEANP